MADLFSDEWAKAYMDAWNNDEEITTSLQRAGFNSVVAFGFPDVDRPQFIMTISNGLVTAVNEAATDDIKWDIRATKDDWLSLIVKPPGLMKLGIAYTSRKLRFVKGDYATMIKDPSLASAFVKSFALMGKVL
ncbi:MAG TPA: SCP-2 sterol transfer family protein [Gammaproteobacteria bacterium]|nr:SCP-2 sterol transfer family protein [Gammaproteobacteria bacterium]